MVSLISQVKRKGWVVVVGEQNVYSQRWAAAIMCEVDGRNS